MKPEPSPFAADPALWEALEQRAIPIDLNADGVLFRQGDQCTGLYILYSGGAEMVMGSDAGEPIAHFQATAGSLLGLPAVLANQPYSLTAIAYEGSQVNFIGQDDLRTLMGSEPHLALKIIQVLVAEIRSARAEIISVVRMMGK